MMTEHRASVWFYVGIASLTLALGPFFLGFLAVVTWGLIFLPVVALLWIGPLMLLHWLLWGRALSEQVAESPEVTADRLAIPRTKRPTRRMRALRLAGTFVGVLGVVLYYLALLGAL